MKRIMDENGNWLEYECEVKRTDMDSSDFKEGVTHRVTIKSPNKVGYFLAFNPKMHAKKDCLRRLPTIQKIYELELRKRGLTWSL
jgi:hypothetical protein